MKRTVKVIIKNEQTKIKVPTGIRLLIRRCCNAVLVNEGIKGHFEVNVVFVDNEQIKQLNNKYRQKDKETDVLSFPLSDDGKTFDKNPETDYCMLGDIVLSIEKAIEQANTYGHTLEREIGFLSVHSMLHLIGYDHEVGGLSAVKMQEKEEAIMIQIGLPKRRSYI